MPRPINCRRVGCLPQATYYKPSGIPMALLQQTTLTVDEFEAIRLADLQGMYHEQAAEKMNVSRQTFGRILESAHKKIADALVNGKALSIQGGSIKLTIPPEMVPPPPHRFRHGRYRGGRGRGRLQ
jgi:predicted DNA-binding protein (UPF0251 family)